MALRALVAVASLTDPGSVIRSSYISDLSEFQKCFGKCNVSFC